MRSVVVSTLKHPAPLTNSVASRRSKLTVSVGSRRSNSNVPPCAATCNNIQKRVYGKRPNRFQDANKSQLTVADSPACDRIAFACCFLETGLLIWPPEQSRER